MSIRPPPTLTPGSQFGVSVHITSRGTIVRILLPAHGVHSGYGGLPPGSQAGRGVPNAAALACIPLVIDIPRSRSAPPQDECPIPGAGMNRTAPWGRPVWRCGRAGPLRVF